MHTDTVLEQMDISGVPINGFYERPSYVSLEFLSFCLLGTTIRLCQSKVSLEGPAELGKTPALHSISSGALHCRLVVLTS